MTREDTFQAAVAKGAFRGLHEGRAEPREARINLPWPNPKLSPNARSKHWGPRARAAAASRSQAFWYALNAFGQRPPKWSAVKLDVEFLPPDKRRRDRDNLIASLKAAMDGISDALGIDDSRFVSTYRIGEPIKGGLVRVTISEEVSDERARHQDQRHRQAHNGPSEPDTNAG